MRRVLFASLLLASLAPAAEPPGVDPAVDRAAERAVAYLVSAQRPDGMIRDAGHDTAMTALAVMAMASVGVQPVDDTPEGRAMAKALAYVLRDDRSRDGYFGAADGSRMYGHGIAALMLTEMRGMGVDAAQDRLIAERCEAAVAVILDAQQQPKSDRHQGGWRYTPQSNDSDLSATVWQLMALRSAANDGMDVPAAAIDEAVAYLRRSYAPARRRGDGDGLGGFTYQPRGGQPAFATTAAGLLAMQVCGRYDDPECVAAADWLLANPPDWGARFCCYGTYYYAQGLFQRGGRHAEEAERRVRTMLLKEQAADGSWRAGNGSESGIGKVYATSMSLLSLSVRHHVLPIYQR